MTILGAGHQVKLWLRMERLAGMDLV